MSERRGVERPSTAYLDAMTHEIDRRIAGVARSEVPEGDTAEAYAGQRLLWQAVEREVAALDAKLRQLAMSLHAHPELAFEEHESAEVLAAAVEKRGFAVARGAHGVGTAFRAEWSSAGFDPSLHPTVAVMSEYDALPGIGHACGHNIIGPSGVGAFLAAVTALQYSPIDGRVVLVGTPAEEGHSGKEYMIGGGMLDGVDAAVMIHPFSFDVASHAWVGRRTLRVTFTGVSAHASSQPFMGRNALDAAALAYQGIGLLRQQMPPSDRLHAVITEGGHRPSVIPNQATMDLYVRSTLTRALADLSSRVDDILEGAALMAGVEVTKQWDVHPATLPIRNNEAIAARWARTQAERGRLALPAGTVPDTLAASTDFGNVSQLVPSIHPMVKIAPQGVALHTEEFARWAGSEEGMRGLHDSAVGLGQVIVDLLADPQLLALARAEFQAAGGAQTVDEVLGGV